MCCCTVCCCCVVVRCVVVVVLLCCAALLCYCCGHRLRVTTLSCYTAGLIPSVVTLQLQHRVVTVGCCTAVLHCCAALLRCCAVLHCCAALLCCTVVLLLWAPSSSNNTELLHLGVEPHSIHRKVALRGTEVVTSHRSKTGHRPTNRIQSVARERVTVGF